jgi:hypothetical protein
MIANYTNHGANERTFLARIVPVLPWRQSRQSLRLT